MSAEGEHRSSTPPLFVPSSLFQFGDTLAPEFREAKGQNVGEYKIAYNRHRQSLITKMQEEADILWKQFNLEEPGENPMPHEDRSMIEDALSTSIPWAEPHAEPRVLLAFWYKHFLADEYSMCPFQEAKQAAIRKAYDTREQLPHSKRWLSGARTFSGARVQTQWDAYAFTM